ncbi:hypothetical protein Barb6_01768 [Bacteroidales bacterium Barb6]|nr:hypothetical protein Barb6_01768 [Bacteroidales bacterium Barb6]
MTPYLILTAFASYPDGRVAEWAIQGGRDAMHCASTWTPDFSPIYSAAECGVMRTTPAGTPNRV